MAADPGRPSPTVSLTVLFALALTVLLLPTAALPSNPAYLAAFPDGHCAFLIEPPMLHVLNLADGINAQEGLPKAKDESHQLPFSLDNGTALAYAGFTSDDDDDDVNKSTSFTLVVYAGRCNSSSATVWMYTAHNSTGNRSPGGNWNHHPVHHRAVTGFRGPGFLSAMATFAPARGASPQLLTFGGLCPAADTSPNKAALAGLLDEIYEDQSGLDSAAAYSSTLVALSPNSRRGFHARLPSTHSAGPVAEAGLTVTPLLPMYASNRGTGLAAKTRAHQTILLLGGHTAHAFVNMSTIALLSLPEAAWSYVVADTDPSLGHGQYGAPMAVEPRSGHTATLTPDGSRVIVVGGWVGDTETPAWPQLLVLEIGIEGGAGDRWRWRAAKGGKSSRQKGIGENETGIYGHGATMLPGGILMVAGGHHIGSSNHKRSADSSSSSSFSPVYLFDTTSESWTTIYNPLTSSPTSEPASVPHHTSHHSSPLSTTAAKAGLASGVSVAGAATVALVALTVYKCACLRRRRDERRTREGMLRSLALDSDADVNVAEPAMTETMGQRSWTGRSIGGSGNPFADPVGEHDGQLYQQNGGNNSPFADPKRVSDNRNRSSNHETTALLAKPLPPPPASDDGVPLVDVDLGTPFASAVKGDYHAVPGADQDGGEEHESNANEDGDRSSVNDKGNDTASTHRSRALLALSTGSNDHHHAYSSLAVAPMQSTTHNQQAQVQIERWSRMGQSIPSNNLSALMALQLATGDEILNENGNGDGHDDEDERRGLLSPVSPILASSEEPGDAKAFLSPKQQLNLIPLIPCPQPTPPPSPPNPPPIPNQAPICSNTATTMEPNPSLAINPRPINRRLSVSSSVFTPRTTTPRALLGSVRRTLGSIRRWEPDIRATRVRPLSAMLFQDEEDDDGDNDRGYGFGGYSRFAESRLRWQGRNCGAGCNAEGSGESRRSGRPGQLRPPASAIAARHNWHPDASGLLLEPQAGTGTKTALGQGQQHQGPGQGQSSSLGATGPGGMFTDTAIENETAALMAALRPGAQDWERPRRRSRTVAATMRSTIEGSGTDSGSGSGSGAGNRTMARCAPLHARHRSEPAWKPSPHTGRPGPRVDSSEAAATSNKNNKSNPSSATTSVPPRHVSASSTSTSITPCMSTSTSTSDWDVEAAAEMRAVQVATTNAFTTFTVPRERLRVVNAGPGDRSEDEGEGPEGR